VARATCCGSQPTCLHGHDIDVTEPISWFVTIGSRCQDGGFPAPRSSCGNAVGCRKTGRTAQAARRRAKNEIHDASARNIGGDTAVSPPSAGRRWAASRKTLPHRTMVNPMVCGTAARPQVALPFLPPRISSSTDPRPADFPCTPNQVKNERNEIY
jgi:hypothetical protein